MPNATLDILVLLRETNDPRPPARVTTRGAGISERGLRRTLNPADLAALEEALCLKDSLGATVTVLAIGPARLDDTIRLAFSLGAERGIRFWDHGMEGGDASADARVLARIITILSPSLVFTGNRVSYNPVYPIDQPVHYIVGDRITVKPSDAVDLNGADIFDKFYRIPSAKSNEVNGFGLGLYYVKKICNLHHWKIKAANNLEYGLTITLLIPSKK